MALCWGRGAAGLRRALRCSGRPRPAAEEGSLGGLWALRRSSSASLQEHGSRKDWGHVELLEVLEARVRQLQAESQSQERLDTFYNRTPGRWAQKLVAEQQKLQKCQKDVAAKVQARATMLQTRLRVAPRLWTKQLASCLELKEQVPQEEQLARALQEALRVSGHKKTIKNKTADAKVVQQLLPFLQCCLITGHLPLAHHMLVTYHGRRYSRQLLTLAMYNTVMLGWARKGAFQQLVYVFLMLRDSGLSPDLLSYACLLQCMGRRNQDAPTIRRCVEQMVQDGLQPQQLFTELPLCEEERAALLRAVVRAEPAFSPPPQASLPVNTSELLREVYAKDGPVSYPKLHLPLEVLQDLFHQQLRVELDTIVRVQSVEKPPPVTREVLRARKTLESLRELWEEALLQAVRRAKTSSAYEAYNGRPSVYPFLCVLGERQLVQVLMQFLQELPAQGESFIWLAYKLGLRVFTRQLVQQKQTTNQVQELGERYTQYLQLLASDTQVPPCLPRQYWEALGPAEAPPQDPWPLHVLLRVGKELAELLVQTVQMPRSLGVPGTTAHCLIPVLYHVYSFRNCRQVGILKPHPALMQLLATAAEPTLIFETTEVPMLCPPLPWTSPHMGAYLLSSTKLMRAMEGIMQHQRLLERCPPGQLHGVLDALTQLGNCAWRVNQPVLDLVLELFRDKGCARLGVPPPPSQAPKPPEHHLPPGTSPSRRAEVRRELARCLKVAREMQGLRSEALYRLSLAQHLRERVFWLPHNMDFRGRTYPCPPHLNHLGSDLARALLEFAEGRPLGPHGLDWLKIHLVNLTGLKKRHSLRARLDFANKVMDDILDSADRPMTGRKWWMQSEDPWQTLACCMEVARAVRSLDPSSYVSHLPVHQDGSCNGLQHYAALGRDKVGAASVNLVPSDLPQDVYSEVAAQVEESRRQDALRGLEVAQVLQGFINRKVVKQTVMTVVYGVTRFGGRLQIEKRLSEIQDFPQEFLWEASHYLVRQVFQTLQEMFSSTRAIQHWLTQSAHLISKAGWPVEWVTPLGLPVIQPYHRDAMVQVLGGMQSITCTNSSDISQKPNTLKQKNGFPPNFIHSLDSSHMMLTALHCYRKGLTFVSVHDCFWTHAADIPVMNKVCREQFVQLHSQPILQDLARFLETQFCSRSLNLVDRALVEKLQETLQAMPETGTFDLDQVKESPYFFS